MDLALLPLLLAAGLVHAPVDDPFGLVALDVSDAPRRIVELPKSTHRTIRRTFSKYTRVLAPNGRPIHVLAQSGWSEDRIVKARMVLEHILRDAPGTRYGHDKSAVANAMSEQGATLVLFDDEPALERALRGPLGDLDMPFQDLRANECPIEGEDDYLAHGTRDASFEEILHFVHDYGIRPAMRDYDRELQTANLAAVERDIWEPWPRREPDSHRNEYIAALYDNYLDLWRVPPTIYEGEDIRGEVPEGCSHFGAMQMNSRAMLAEVDPVGLELVEAFFHDHLTYTPELPEDFDGTFVIDRDPELRYTTKSQYLVHVRLRGKADANLVGNDRDNQLFGNAGKNRFEGRGGNDLLVGGEGRDTARYRGSADQYEQTEVDGGVRVRDLVAGRDGTDFLVGIEVVEFASAR